MKKIIIAACFFIICSFQQVKLHGINEKLSDYAFFEGNIADLKPTKGVFQYALNTPLFSDYAEKLRFIKLPDAGKVDYNKTEVFDFDEHSTQSFRWVDVEHLTVQDVTFKTDQVVVDLLKLTCKI